jgi:hypothetical protein
MMEVYENRKLFQACLMTIPFFSIVYIALISFRRYLIGFPASSELSRPVEPDAKGHFAAIYNITSMR